MLKYAYSLIKSNPGNMTAGADNETLDGIDANWFVNTSNDILKGSYQFRGPRRVEIPKANNNGTRSLTVGNPRDKIVQKAMEIVLNYIYEFKLAKFSDSSHGFRPNRGCHSAFEQIKYKWKSIPWYIEFDIKKAFDSINRKKLLTIIGEDIEDRSLITLLDKMFNSKILSGSELMDCSSGVPQGNILSPLLSNIYFNVLDQKIEQLILKYNKGQYPTENRAYKQAVAITDKERFNRTTAQINS